MEEDCGGVRMYPEGAPDGVPEQLKDGSFKWGNKTFKDEKELGAFIEDLFEKK